MRYRCKACKKEKEFDEDSPINLLCDCGSAEGQFNMDAVIQCVHCGEERPVVHKELVSVRNGCYLSRGMGQIALWTVRSIQSEKKKQQKRTLTGRFSTTR